MTLTYRRDVSAADWITHSDLPWQQVVGFGPAGFEAYARLRFLPDPAHPGQSENDAEGDGRPDQLPALFEQLARHTATPEDCYFCVWEGFGHVDVALDTDAVYLDDEDADDALGQPGARPGLAPEPDSSGLARRLPKIVLPHRAYWLFRGPLADVGTWDTAQGWPDACRLDGSEPAFVWPRDRAWCVANDVDPHWAGIGGSQALISRLTTDPGLDVVPADPAADQPVYQ